MRVIWLTQYPTRCDKARTIELAARNYRECDRPTDIAWINWLPQFNTALIAHFRALYTGLKIMQNGTLISKRYICTRSECIHHEHVGQVELYRLTRMRHLIFNTTGVGRGSKCRMYARRHWTLLARRKMISLICPAVREPVESDVFGTCAMQTWAAWFILQQMKYVRNIKSDRRTEASHLFVRHVDNGRFMLIKSPDGVFIVILGEGVCSIHSNSNFWSARGACANRAPSFTASAWIHIFI